MVRQVDLAVEVLEASDRVRGADRRGEPDLRAAVERERGAAVSAAELGRVIPVEEQFVRAARAAGRQARPAAYLSKLRRRSPSGFRQAPRALPALQELRGAGFRIGLISNTIGEPGAFLRPVLQEMGFGPLIDQWVFSDECRSAEPAPRIFRAALRALGPGPPRTIHVGDGWSDIEGARVGPGSRAGVLFTGLSDYGSSYRKLFLGPSKGPPEAQYPVRTARRGSRPRPPAPAPHEADPMTYADLPDPPWDEPRGLAIRSRRSTRS